MMKHWLISNYGGPSRIVGDIINNLATRTKPTDKRKEKFTFYSAISGAIQRLERQSRISHINRAELESCLLSRSTPSSLINLLPIPEYDLWVREMTVPGLDFRNPVGHDTFACFKRICIIGRNMNESFGDNVISKDVQSLNIKKTIRSTYKVQGQDEGESDQEICVLADRELNPKPWNPASELKFACPLTGHKHEVRKCKEFFDMSPRDRWEKLEDRMCYSCLKPKTICKGRKCC